MKAQEEDGTNRSPVPLPPAEEPAEEERSTTMYTRKSSKNGKRAAVAAAALLLVCTLLLCSCSSLSAIGLTLTGNGSTSGTSDTDGAAVQVVSVEKTGTDGTESLYTITYSDGSTSVFTMTDDSGETSLSLSEIYEEYCEITGNTDLTLEEFLGQYMSVEQQDSASVIGSCLLSVMRIYSEFVVTTASVGPMMRPGSVSDTTMSTGSAVIYAMDEAEGYTYIVTNYHVVYSSDADSSKNGGSKIARTIHGYLYGSATEPYADGTDSDGYTRYEYGADAVELEYIGGSVTADLAVLRVKTSDLTAINEQVRPVTLAQDYQVGETAIAIGNPEGEGLSVTQGIISTENEQIVLDIDGTARYYRSIRIDTPLYSGNSGGGLFNSSGELIGITNAGNSSDQNINYAVPLEIVRGTVENILWYYRAGGTDTVSAYKITIGITVYAQNAKYVYDSASGTGEVVEEILVESVVEDSIAGQIGLCSGDRALSLVINGTEYELSRTFDISDLILTMREGDVIQLRYERAGATALSGAYTLSASDFEAID